jgi:hypothetical protein
LDNFLEKMLFGEYIFVLNEEGYAFHLVIRFLTNLVLRQPTPKRAQQCLT